MKKTLMLKLFAACLLSTQAFASVYHLPSDYESLIGEVRYKTVQANDSVSTIAQRYDLGRNAIISANPQIDPKTTFRSGAFIQIPTQHLLPNETRRGIVVNLPEMRMYYYLEDTNEVLTYPIGIGKVGKTIPIERARVTRKAKDPIWIPTEDIRAFNLEQGIVLPKIMPSGPDNPLGEYAIYMSIPTYLFHSTPFPDSIGKRASFGCIRMYKWDIENLFPAVKRGVPITIINAPTKAGWQNNRLYLEAHKPLEEHQQNYNATLPGIVHLITKVSTSKPTLVDWQLVSYISETRDGLPHQIGIELNAN